MPIAQSLRATSTARLVFLCSPGDNGEVKACRAAARRYNRVDVHIVDWPAGDGDYARKINYGLTVTEEPWLFQAGDDLAFSDGWDRLTLQAADPGFRVVGTNDLGNPRVGQGRHSTHSLVSREYVETFGGSDEPGKMLHEGYRHNFVDDELVFVAMKRRTFVFAARAIVEHLHPHWGKGATDETYERGLAGFRADAILNRARRRDLARMAARP